MIRTDKRMRLCAALLICELVFIWGNSLMPGEVSQAISNWVQKLLMDTRPDASGNPVGNGILRKIAHFTEFAALGMTLAWLCSMLQKKKWWPFPLGAAAACIDETIQAFTPGRAPGIRDVCIDSCGVLFGMFLLWLGHTYYQKTHKNQNLEDK